MTDRTRHCLVAFLVLVTIRATVGISALLACPQETVTCGPFEVRQMKGKIEPPYNEAILPTEMVFVIRAKGEDKSERRVQVQSDGTFIIGVPEGRYEFEIKAEGFLFTLVGEVIVSLEAKDEQSILISPPWC